jgi:hypothetical protein
MTFVFCVLLVSIYSTYLHKRTVYRLRITPYETVSESGEDMDSESDKASLPEIHP